MEKKQFQKIVKDRLKIIGFHVKGNYCYKMLDNDYLVGVTLDHNSYCKGYFIEYGGAFLTDEDKTPFQGVLDWDDRFLFTKNPNDDLNQYTIENLGFDDEGLTECFEYDIRTPEDLVKQLETNINKKLMRVEDKEFILTYYLENIDVFITLPDKIISKLLKQCEFDIDEIKSLRKKCGYIKCDF